MRLIDADELLEWLEWLEHCDGGLDRDSLDIAIDGALQTVAMHVDNMDTLEWTPVSEGLPNDYDMVLVTIDSGGKGCITYCQYEYDDVAERGVFKDANGIDIWISGEEVTAWMRLPEPWKGEEEC